MMLHQLQNVLVPHELIENPPSRVDGVDAETEMKLRIFGCELIQEAGILLQLPQVAMATAQVLFHRFFFRRSFKSYDAKMLSMAALFCAAKAEEHPRRSRDIINVFNRIDEIRRGIKIHQPIDFTRQKYVDMKNELIRQERHLLKELGFNVFVEHAHKFIVNYLGVLALSNNKELAQLAWNYLNDSLRTIVYVKFPSEVIATAAIYMAARMLQIPLPESPAWWELFDATKAQLDEIAWHITRLYDLPSMTRYTSSTQILTGNDEPPSTGSDVPSPHAERYSDDRNGSSRGRDSKRSRSRSRSREDHKRRRTSRSRSPRRDSRRRSRSRDRYSRDKDRGRDSRRSRSRDRNRDRDRRRSRSGDRYRSNKRDSSRERRR
jgi:hypothetical protein